MEAASSRKQAKVAYWLEHLLHLSIQEEYRIGPYSIDIWLPEWLLAVEVDGPSHKLRARKDATRDSYLLARGVPTLRLSTATTLAQVTTAVVAFIEEYSPTAAERREVWLRS